MAACSRALDSLKMVAASSSSVHQSPLSLPTLERRTATAGNDCRILTPSPSIWSRAEILPYPTPCRRSYSVDKEGRIIMSISDQILSELRESDQMKSRKVQLLLLLRSPSAPRVFISWFIHFRLQTPHLQLFLHIFTFYFAWLSYFPSRKKQKRIPLHPKVVPLPFTQHLYRLKIQLDPKKKKKQKKEEERNFLKTFKQNEPSKLKCRTWRHLVTSCVSLFFWPHAVCVCIIVSMSYPNFFRFILEFSVGGEITLKKMRTLTLMRVW